MREEGWLDNFIEDLFILEKINYVLCLVDDFRFRSIISLNLLLVEAGNDLLDLKFTLARALK